VSGKRKSGKVWIDKESLKKHLAHLPANGIHLVTSTRDNSTPCFERDVDLEEMEESSKGA